MSHPNPKDLELIPTKDFKEGAYPFETFNYLQSLVYPLKSLDNNLIISAATSAGKTVCAELLIEDCINKGKKAIFLCPLKALSSEKYDDWTSKSHYFSSYNIEIITGDKAYSKERATKIASANIIIMTSEMLDTRTRYYSPTNDNNWLDNVGVVVVDESHLLTTSRGPALEVGLMNFTSINKNSRVCLLSATMSNTKEISTWIQSLNNKTTDVVNTPWRPVDLHAHKLRVGDGSTYEFCEEIADTLDILVCNEQELGSYLLSSSQTQREMAKNRADGGKENTKTLVFVHTKVLGKQLEQTLKQKGYAAKFHNADLDKKARNKLEKDFRGKLDILIATSTLAWGVNLPARNVIICGNKRGREYVSDIDLVQMAGRAGRFGMYPRGDVYYLNCNPSTSFPVKSSLEAKLAFHSIAELFSKRFQSEEGALRWIGRSLWAVQDRDHQEVTKAMFSSLLSSHAIKSIDKNKYEVTPYGKIARDLYMDPEAIYQWATNFKVIESKNLWDSKAAMSWALTNDINSDFYIQIHPQLKTFYQKELTKVSSSLTANLRTNPTASCVYYRMIREELSQPARMKFDKTTNSPGFQMFLRDSGRMFSAIQRISKILEWEKEVEIQKTQARVVYGVGEHLLDLVSLPGIGAQTASQLYQAGLKTKEEIINNLENLEDYLEKKATITRVKKGMAVYKQEKIQQTYEEQMEKLIKESSNEEEDIDLLAP